MTKQLKKQPKWRNLAALGACLNLLFCFQEEDDEDEIDDVEEIEEIDDVEPEDQVIVQSEQQTYYLY